MASIIAFICILFLYTKAASVSERSYNVTIDGADGSQALSSEEIIYQEKKLR
jgi:hypothetical protein